VRRLENYQTRYAESFPKVVEAIHKEFVPLLEQHSVSGEALVRSKNPYDFGGKMIINLLDFLRNLSIEI
jgi:hypothetical protein